MNDSPSFQATSYTFLRLPLSSKLNFIFFFFSFSFFSSSSSFPSCVAPFYYFYHSRSLHLRVFSLFSFALYSCVVRFRCAAPTLFICAFPFVFFLLIFLCIPPFPCLFLFFPVLPSFSLSIHLPLPHSHQDGFVVLPGGLSRPGSVRTGVHGEALQHVHSRLHPLKM